ncbi:hypothetical protein J3E68DRAFT_190651 [Trichoderma sp. SZMC 28012]
MNLGFPPSGPLLSCGQSSKRNLEGFADSFANQESQGSENGCNPLCPITYHSCKEQIMQRAFSTIQARNTSTLDGGPLTIAMPHLLSGIASQYKRQGRSSKHRVVQVSLSSSQGVENCRHAAIIPDSTPIGARLLPALGHTELTSLAITILSPPDLALFKQDDRNWMEVVQLRQS